MDILNDEEALWGLLFFIWVFAYAPTLLNETADIIAKGDAAHTDNNWLRSTLTHNNYFKTVWFVGLFILMVTWYIGSSPQTTGIILFLIAVGWVGTKIK